MSVQYIRIDKKEQLRERVDNLCNRINAFWNWDQHSLIVSYDVYTDPRTKAQNRMMWKWFEEMANHYSRAGAMHTKEDMHDLMCHKFLGYEDRLIGSTLIKGQLCGTSKLKKPEMSEFLHKVEAWNTDNGLLVTIPADSDYMTYRQARQ